MGNKIIRRLVPTLIGALSVISLIGSVSGSLAWYLNSNKATVSYIGASMYSTQNLEMSFGNGDAYGPTKLRNDVTSYASGGRNVTAAVATGDYNPNDLYYEVTSSVEEGEYGPYTMANGDVLSIVTNPTEEKFNQGKYYKVSQIGEYKHDGSDFLPITPGTDLASDDELPSGPMYMMPILGNYPYTSWEMTHGKEYLQIPISLRVKQVDGEVVSTFLERDVYLTDITVDATINSGNITRTQFLNGVRIHLHTEDSDVLLANDAYNLPMSGALDLNNDGNQDTMIYAPGVYETDPNANDVGIYGDQTQTYRQKTTNWNDYTKAEEVNGEIVTHGASSIGRTTTDGENPLTVVVTVWLEAWSLLPITNLQTFNVSFKLGMSFSVASHE